MSPQPPRPSWKPATVAATACACCWWAWACGAAAGWFALDAAFTYPRHNRQHAQLEAFQARHGEESAVLWPEYARANKWETNYNAASGQSHSELDILTQWGIAGFTSLAGFGCLVFFFSARRRFVRLEGEGADLVLSDHCGLRLALADMEAIDAHQWETNGKAVVRGKGARIKLDDWKMEPDPTAAIFHVLADAGVKVEGLEPAVKPV